MAVVRISGVNLPGEKRVIVALTYIYGVGDTSAKKILTAAKVSEDVRTKDLTEPQIAAIREQIEKSYTVEGDLQRQVSTNIKRLKDINSFVGLRHKNNLPVHGQRTKTNARTKRGKRVTMGSGRKKAASKT